MAESQASGALALLISLCEQIAKLQHAELISQPREVEFCVSFDDTLIALYDVDVGAFGAIGGCYLCHFTLTIYEPRLARVTPGEAPYLFGWTLYGAMHMQSSELHPLGEVINSLRSAFLKHGVEL